MFPSDSKRIPVPPRNPGRTASRNDNLLSVEFGLDQTLQKLESTKYEEMNPYADETTKNNISTGGAQSITHPGYSAHRMSEEIPITRIDDIIARHGGKTASIDRLPEQLKMTKGRLSTAKEELFELKQEVGRLRAEIAYHERVRRVLMDLYSKTVEMYKTSTKMMERQHEAVQTSSQGLAKAEREFLHFWGISISPEEDRRWDHGLDETPGYI